MPIRSHRPITQVLVATSLFISSLTRRSSADEGGGSFWQPGQNASFVAVPEDPGFSFQLVYFQRAASVSADRPIIIGGNIAAGYYTTNSLAYLTPAYTFAPRVLNGQLAISGSLPVGREQTSVSGVLSAPNGSGPGARLGSFESQVIAAGPQAGYGFSPGAVHLDLNLRGYKEFDAQNRPEGWNVWVTVTVSRATK